MFPLIYIGLLSFSCSFAITHNLVREYLRFKFQNELKEEHKNNIKRKSIKFNEKITVHYIESKSSLSKKTLNDLWYNKKDYKFFKKKYIKSGIYNSI